jgi:hypothetical protein
MEYRKQRDRLLRHERKHETVAQLGGACIDCGTADPVVVERSYDHGIGGVVARCGNCQARRLTLRPARLQQRLREFAEISFPDPACILCPESDLRCLHRHHVAGRANSTLQVPLCRNCHARQSDEQIDALGDLRRVDGSRSPLTRQAAFQFGFALLLLVLAAGMVSGVSGGRDPVLGAFFSLMAAALTGWACWNLAADRHLASAYGTDWWTTVPTTAPS